jgi:hypothetical protein
MRALLRGQTTKSKAASTTPLKPEEGLNGPPAEDRCFAYDDSSTTQGAVPL